MTKTRRARRLLRHQRPPPPPEPLIYDVADLACDEVDAIRLLATYADVFRDVRITRRHNGISRVELHVGTTIPTEIADRLARRELDRLGIDVL